MEFILKSTICMALFWAVYMWFLRSETWYQIQRFYLLGTVVVSIILAFVDLSLPASVRYSQELLPAYEYVNSEFQHSEILLTQTPIKSFDWLFYIQVFYTVIAVILLVKKTVSINQIIKLKNKYGTTIESNVRVVQLPGEVQTFSFLNTVFISENDNKSKNREHVIKHECAHLRQYHTLDLIILELLHAFLWVNPFVILYLRSIKQVHEYLADESVIDSGVDSVKYSQLILNQCCTYSTPILTSSFSSNIQKRLHMLSTKKSNKISQCKLLIALPAIAFIYVLFSCSEQMPSTRKLGISEIQKSSVTSNPNVIPSGIPIEGTVNITSTWGDRLHPIHKKVKHHSGCDFKAPTGTSVLATADGVVSEIPADFEEGKGHGRFVVIDHGDGMKTRYAQLSGYNVKIGQSVTKSFVIGYVGQSGISTGPHLHYEVWKDGKDVDPALYFSL